VSSVLLCTVENHIAHLTLNRAEVRNALNKELCHQLSSSLDDLAQRDDVKVVVISGAGGKAFAAGADISELKERTHKDAFVAVAQRTFQQLADFHKPTIAAIDGYALGGGLELALACDIRVASTASKFGMPEVTLGIFPSAGGTLRLQQLVGLGRAKELIFTGRIFDSTEAKLLGIVESVVQTDVLEEAKKLANQIAQNDSLALQVAKISLNEAARFGTSQAVEWVGQGLLFDSPEKHRRMGEFLNRKKK
jgi:enoyl-CoA hydratase